MLLEIAIGDAYGVGFEYRTKDFVLKNNNLEKYYPHERYASLYRKYSDDTQMSIAIAELMLSEKVWTKETIADKFVEVFKRDVRPGYSAGFYKFLQSVTTGAEFVRKINPNSDKSGAAMRSGLIGLFSSEKEILEKSSLQASVTHNTVEGIKSSQAASLLVHYFAYKKGMKRDVGKYIESVIGVGWNKPWAEPVGDKGWMSVRAAITAIIQNDNMASLLKSCIGFTGDVDTVASIALGAASLSNEIKSNLPIWLYTDLENDLYGREYLIQLDMGIKSLNF